MTQKHKFNSIEAATAKIQSIVKALPHEITKLNDLGECLFQATSPIDKGYIVVCGSLFMSHDEKFNKVWTVKETRGM